MNKEQIYKVLHTNQINTDTYEIPTTKSQGHIIADDIYSDVDIPMLPVSMRDGYAVRYHSSILKSETTFNVIGEVRAGTSLHWVLNPGEAVYITTGAVIPEYCDTVVMVEYTTVTNSNSTKLLTVTDPKQLTRQWIRTTGEDISRGTLLVRAGTKINNAVIGTLVTVGVKKAVVYKKLTIGVLSTGNEVVDIDSSVNNLDEYSIYDSNKPMIISYINSKGYFVRDLGIVRDSEQDVFNTLEGLVNSDLDIIITSGGVSMGDKDFVKSVLVRLGAEILIDKTTLKPGRPMVMSRLNGKIIFSLPGNPVASVLSTMLFIVPFVTGDYSFTKIVAHLKHPVTPDPSRQEHFRGIVEYNRERNCFVVGVTTKNQLSSNTFSLVGSNCLIDLAPGNGPLVRGTNVNVIVYDKILDYKPILTVGVVTMSDRASSGIYEDKSGMEITNYLRDHFDVEYQVEYRLIPDTKETIKETLVDLVDNVHCHLVLTTGGTGPSLRDNTVEITEQVCHKLLPGFGEVMRSVNFAKVPTSILSAQTAGIRFNNPSTKENNGGGCLIVNLPGSPKSIKECLDIVAPSFYMCTKILGSPLINLK